MSALLEPLVTKVEFRDTPVTLGAATAVKLAEPVAVVPAALEAVTVQVPVPVPEVPTVRLPEVALALPDAVPVQDTVAEVAPAVAQLNVLVPPVVVYALAKAFDVTLGAATTVTEGDDVTL